MKRRRCQYAVQRVTSHGISKNFSSHRTEEPRWQDIFCPEVHCDNGPYRMYGPSRESYRCAKCGSVMILLDIETLAESTEQPH